MKLNYLFIDWLIYLHFQFKFNTFEFWDHLRDKYGCMICSTSLIYETESCKINIRLTILPSFSLKVSIYLYVTMWIWCVVAIVVGVCMSMRMFRAAFESTERLNWWLCNPVTELSFLKNVFAWFRHQKRLQEMGRLRCLEEQRWKGQNLPSFLLFIIRQSLLGRFFFSKMCATLLMATTH